MIWLKEVGKREDLDHLTKEEKQDQPDFMLHLLYAYGKVNWKRIAVEVDVQYM